MPSPPYFATISRSVLTASARTVAECRDVEPQVMRQLSAHSSTNSRIEDVPHGVVYTRRREMVRPWLLRTTASCV